jgi:hypothetical protein
MGLIERMFETKAVRMGPSRHEPARQVATFDPEAVRALADFRRAELEKFHWLAGDWTYENPVPATRVSPAYCDVGEARFTMSDDGAWMCAIGRDDRPVPLITFDPWSRLWMYVLTNGSYGILRSSGWEAHRIIFNGTMTMLGVTCEWRMAWEKRGQDEFSFVNEERSADGTWNYIDEWRYRRKRAV